MESIKSVNVCTKGENCFKSSKTGGRADELRDWTFRVRLPPILLDKAETVCITGSSEELGLWKSNSVVKLSEEGDTNMWTAVIQIPSSIDVRFRYCVCIVTSEPRKVIVRKWETNVSPRIIKTTDEQTEDIDIFGEYGGVTKIDNGWLSAGKIIQFRIIQNSVSFENYPKLRIKLVTLNSDLKLRRNINDVINEVANQKADDPKFKPQNKYGLIYSKDDLLVFNSTIPNNDVDSFLFQFYEESVDNIIGFSHILLLALKESRGKLTIPVTSTGSNQLIGSVSIEYLIINPIVDVSSTMEVGYSNYWDESWKGLEVGHRGMGSSFKIKGDNLTRENTIAGFQKAGLSGADMVEFDVQLSKDLIPVIYHDFHLALLSKDKNGNDFPEMVELPIYVMNNNQLQNMRIYHVTEAKQGVYPFDEDTPKPFPPLKNVFDEVDLAVGFNIEIKIDGDPIDMNLYLDKILQDVFTFGGSRKIIFSCFDPDVCAAVRMKQNFYPVFFLTEKGVPDAVKFALNASLLGIVPESTELLDDPSLVTLVRDAGLKHFCWGDKNNDKVVINQLKAWGLEGIIFDKIDIYSTKPKKESIFKNKKF